MDDPRTKIQEALKQAMINKDVTTRDVLRMVTSAFKQVEIDERRQLTAEDAVAILQKDVKRRRESVEEARKVGREDIAHEEETQLKVIEQFLPQQMSRDEIAVIVREVIAKTGATTAKDMGKVMGALMPRVKGLADGKLVNEVVRELLQG
jgi:uncharacterized protein YqeY